MVRILVVILLCCGANGLAAQFCAKLPYQLVGGKMIVKARVNGVEGKFLFDTGAPVCLTHSFAAKVGVKDGNEVRFQDSNGQVSTSRVVTLNSVLSGGVNFSQVECAVFEEGNMIENFGVDGVMGYTLFRDKIVELNGEAQQITISDDPDYFSLNPAWACEMAAHPYVPYIPVKIGDQEMDTVMFDSGAAGFYEMSEKSFQRLQKSDGMKVLSKGHGILSLGASGLEERSEKYRVEIPEFACGTGKFHRVTSVTTKGESRLGANLLNYGVVTIDYRQRKFYFQPLFEKTPDMYRKEWNVVITVMNNGLTAGFVWESMKDQLEGGEKIVEINGKRFDKVDAWQAMSTNLIDLSAGKAQIVVIDKKTGKERKLEIRQE